MPSKNAKKGGKSGTTTAAHVPAPARPNWEGNIERVDFLEIAALRRILLSGVSVTRHVMGLVHPISIFTTKNFDGIFWYHRHSAGVHQYDFRHLVDVLPVTGAASVGDSFPNAIVEMTRSGKYDGDLAARAFVLVFNVPLDQANLQVGSDASVAARVAGDQQATFYGNQAGGSLTDGTVTLSVDLVCDNQWSYESLLEGFTLIKTHYGDLLNSPEMGRLREMGGVGETFARDTYGAPQPAPGGLESGLRGIEAAASGALGRAAKDDKTGIANQGTQLMNSLHQLYQPEHHPNHRAKFKIKSGTEVEVMFKPSAYKCCYTKKGMEELEVDLSANKYFRPGKYCLGTIVRRYRDDTYDVRYMNGPFTMDEDPDHTVRPLFPRRGLLFKRVPKAFLIVDYDAQLASRFPYGMLFLSAVQTFYYFYYAMTTKENTQGEVTLWDGVAGAPILYLQSMGGWPSCENLIWGQGQYWRLASYQMVHFGANHIGFNMLAQLLFGTPIERVHGTGRIMLLYELGVIGGALFAGWTDPMKIVVGASGGVYTILGAHWANMAIAWDAMKNGTVPPFARMFVLASLMGIDLIQYFFYRAGGTSYAVHLGGWIVGFAGGILVLRELEADFWETYVVKPLAAVVFLGMMAYSVWWDAGTWPPAQPQWVTDINFGDNTKQCCWLVSECASYAADQGSGAGALWGPAQWEALDCHVDAHTNAETAVVTYEYSIWGDYPDDPLETCSAMYDYATSS